MIEINGRVSYGNYSWDSSAAVKATIQPIYEDGERTVIKHRLIVNIKWVITNDNGTDSDLTAVRALLGTPGKLLYISDYGLGTDYKIGPGGQWEDIAFGPKPRVIVWEPVGGANAGAVEWECTADFIPCGSRSGDKPIAMGYEFTHDIDERGLCHRSYTGYIEIPNNKNGHNPIRSPDSYREYFNPILPPGFRRKQTYTGSMDRTRLNFAINDDQIPSRNAFPPGCTNADASHRLNWRRGKGSSMNLYNTLSATYEIAPDFSPAVGLMAFGRFASARIKAARDRNKVVFIEAVDIEESCYNLGLSCSLSYRTLASLAQVTSSAGGNGGAVEMGNVVRDLGMFADLGDNWSAWKASMKLAFDPYGATKQAHNAQDDIIIGMCDTANGVTQRANTAPAAVRSQFQIAANEKPTLGNSWLEFRATISPIQDRPVTVQSVLQTPNTDTVEVKDTSNYFLPSPRSASASQDIVQESGPTRYKILFTGEAKRIGYPVPRVTILSVNGVKCTEIKAQYHPRIVGNYFGVTQYASKWSVLYALPTSPGKVDNHPNWAEKIDKDGNATL